VAVRVIHLVTLVLALAAIVFVTTRRDTRVVARAPQVHPLSLVPPGPAFVASLDLGRIRKTDAGMLLEHADLGGLIGTSKDCSFDPVRDLDRIIVTSAEATESAPGAPSAGGLALIASGRFSAKQVIACAVARIRSRGGEPTVTPGGSFERVIDRRAEGEVAVRDGLLVISDGPYLAAILRIAAGEEPHGSEADRTRDRLHVELRRTFGRGAPLVTTVIVPAGFVTRTFGEEAARSPLASIRSAALRAEVGERVVIGAFLGCANADDCGKLEAFLLETRRDVAPLFEGTERRLLDAIVVRQSGERIELRLELSFAELRELGPMLGLGG